VGLYYSGNGFDWHSAGILDYHLSFGRHFTYPHMTIVGADLLVVMRATFESGKLEETKEYYVSIRIRFESLPALRRFPTIPQHALCRIGWTVLRCRLCGLHLTSRHCGKCAQSLGPSEGCCSQVFVCYAEQPQQQLHQLPPRAAFQAVCKRRMGYLRGACRLLHASCALAVSDCCVLLVPSVYARLCRR